jgi:cation:H+ antiporter
MPFDLSLPWAVGLYVTAAIVVWLAGGRLARDADEIAGRTRWGHAFLGVVLLGGVTSLPEMTIAVTSSIQGTPELSVNDVLGSAAANLVILALADLLVRGRPLSSAAAAPQLLLQGVLGIAMMSLAVGAAVAGDMLVLGMGAWSWLMVGVYLAAVKVL